MGLRPCHLAGVRTLDERQGHYALPEPVEADDRAKDNADETDLKQQRVVADRLETELRNGPAGKVLPESPLVSYQGLGGRSEGVESSVSWRWARAGQAGEAGHETSL